MSNEALAAETLTQMIQTNRGLLARYEKLDEEQQRAIRHECYKKQGDFAKAFFSMAKVFKFLEEKYV